MGTDNRYDFFIIGGGIFGVYSALYLDKLGYSVCLVEKESSLFTRASVVNQARLHGGYHYPRSIATARIADENKLRFIQEHEEFINSTYKNYYAIDRYCSLIDPGQFERFCKYLGILLNKVYAHQSFSFDRIEVLYEVYEPSFDPNLIAKFYKRKIEESGVKVYLSSYVDEVNALQDKWRINIASKNMPGKIQIDTDSAINVTYSSVNTINKLFNIGPINISHELSEICLVHDDTLSQTGLTVMDGPFCSIMPYGLSNILSLSSVIYTHHEMSDSDEPSFTCQKDSPTCKKQSLDSCNTCSYVPKSNYKKMISQANQYLSDKIDLNYLFSLYTVKTKLKSSYIDDGRPTVISKLNDSPGYYCLFSGKINSIYEIERVITDV